MTSSPAPDYVQRVVNVFKDNGGGVRGDLKASIEQYGATLANWFGMDAQAMSYAFPNLPSFTVRDLGFMSPA